MIQRIKSMLKKLPERWPVRYGIAIGAVAVAFALRLALAGVLGSTVAYITFYPMVMLAAILGGFGPGLLATALTLLIVGVWILPPVGQLGTTNITDAVGMIIFLITGTFMSAVAELYHRALKKASEYERVSALRASENALYESNRRLALLSDIANQLLLTDNPQGLVQSLCERVMEFLDCHVFFNFLVDEDKDCLHLNAFAGIPDEAGKSIEWLEYGMAVCGCAARDGCRIVAEDIFNTPDPRTELVKSYGIQAYACHPLLAQGGRVMGTLSFGSRTKTCFTDDDLDLMKAVADQVATAMERIRLLDEVRRRAEEVEKVMEVAPIGIWVGHDPESHNITGNRAANEFFESGEGENVAASVIPVRRFFQNGRELAPEELPMQYAAAHNVEVRDTEFEVEMPSGKRRTLWGYATPLKRADGQVRGSVGAFVDVTEKRELEAHKREFYKRTILAATEGKLIIVEKQDIGGLGCDQVKSWSVSDNESLGDMRNEVSKLSLESGMEQVRVYHFLGCIIEAATNAIKHAHSGEAQLYRCEESLMFVMSDNGPGIGALALPDVALTRNYSTAGTLGMGYKLMINLADRIYLSTGPEGTTVAIEMGIKAQ